MGIGFVKVANLRFLPHTLKLHFERGYLHNPRNLLNIFSIQGSLFKFLASLCNTPGVETVMMALVPTSIRLYWEKAGERVSDLVFVSCGSRFCVVHLQAV